ncbi:uncharacterized protein LOC125587842 [Brassica napus]|uniref:uncharacterized protein LOC125587842 n=1 Tax=Brassica napus TaxID=3708 RepID=UPI00207AFEEE|nr:uncharacterized protein LOC125587842 [Brassica napus]
MARLVRVVKGEWRKSQQGVWAFHEDPTSMSHATLVRENEPIQRVQTIVRGVFNATTQTPIGIIFQLPDWLLEPDGETCPPHNIKTTSDIQLLLSVHSWNTDPTLCVIIGAEAVAKYDFICRAPFTIGAKKFLADGITEEEHLASIRDLIRGYEITCSTKVLHEIFDEDKMVLLYRFSFEIEKAKNSLDLNVAVGDGSGDHVIPVVNNPNGTGHVVGNINRSGGSIELTGGNVSGFGQHEQIINMNDSGMYDGCGGGFIPNLPQSYYRNPWGGEEMRTRYWENIMDSRYALELQRIYGVPGSEHVGYQNTYLIIGNSSSPYQHPLMFLSDDSSRASSGQDNTNGVHRREGSISNIGSQNPATEAILLRGESSVMGGERNIKREAEGSVTGAQGNSEVVGGSLAETPKADNEVEPELTPIKVEGNDGGTTDL